MLSVRHVISFALAASIAAFAAPAMAQQTIKIGELNSYKSQPAFLDPYKKGWEMAVEEINAKGGVLGKKLEVISRDDGANPGEAVRAAEELVTREGVVALRLRVLLGLGEQRRPLLVGGEHDLDQAVIRTRRFLRHLTDTGILRNGDAAGFRREFARDDPEQRRFARAVAAHEADLDAGRKRDGGVIEEKAAGDPGRKIGNGNHGGPVAHSAA